MASLTASPTSRKAPRAYRAIQDETAGVLTQLDGQLFFFSDEGAITAVEVAHLNFLTVLGEIGLSDTQALMDQLHGGAARIACARLQEVA
jgi:hypothetical protein